MASPLFDSISMRLAKRISDPVASAATNGTILTAAARDEYINKAMMEIIRKYWELVKGDTQTFIEIFPELVKTATFNTTAGGTLVISTSTFKNFFKIINAIKGTTVYIKSLPKHLYTVVKTGRFDDVAPDSDNPVVFEIEGTLVFFPSADFNVQSVTAFFLTLPLDTSGGTLYNGHATVDSPFLPIWNEEIAQIAEELFRQDTQRG